MAIGRKNCKSTWFTETIANFSFLFSIMDTKSILEKQKCALEFKKTKQNKKKKKKKQKKIRPIDPFFPWHIAVRGLFGKLCS